MAYTQQHTFADDETLTHTLLNTEFAAIESAWGTISTINLTGGQIAFPATAVPSADPNTIDDYEEGEYVATITCGTSGTVTLDAAGDTVIYVKWGRTVHVHGQLLVASVSSPVGEARVSLPFTCYDGTDTSDYVSGSLIFHNVDYVSSGWVCPMTLANLAYFKLMGTSDAAGWATESADIFSASDTMAFSIVFTAA